MSYLRARCLGPSLGRFLSADSVQPNAPGTQGYDPYAYVANNPTTWLDPSGNHVGTSSTYALSAAATTAYVLANLRWFVGLNVAVGEIGAEAPPYSGLVSAAAENWILLALTGATLWCAFEWLCLESKGASRSHGV